MLFVRGEQSQVVHSSSEFSRPSVSYGVLHASPIAATTQRECLFYFEGNASVLDQC